MDFPNGRWPGCQPADTGHYEISAHGTAVSHPWRTIIADLWVKVAAKTILTGRAENLVRSITAKRAHVDERGSVGIRLKPAVAIGWDVLWLCDPEEPAALGLLAGNIQSKRRPNDGSQHL
jgi:hypothetical protein